MRFGKDTGRISLARLRRAFVGTYALTTRKESWVECGHFLEGFRLMAEEVFETDGDGQIAEETGYFAVEGEAVPPQNSIDDYAFYNAYLRGKRSFAFWCDDDHLWLFKSYYYGNGRITDNRLSVFPKHGYDSPRQQENTKFSGLIGGFEILQVKNFSYVNHKLVYEKIVAREGFGNLRPNLTSSETGTHGN
jgi:hypothetical protein